ncbi:MAG: DUF4038 domain-containing protein [Armatimonadetes bacterium]|nr:DUF4038 domain-containing protein [Armatimonadota bacterium]
MHRLTFPCWVVIGMTAWQGANAAELPRLEVGANGRHLTAGGQPFFWLADTAWWIVRRVGPEEQEEYLTRRAAQGFNVIQVHCGFERPDYAGNWPFVENDPARPNEAFWQHMDESVARAREHGLYVALVPMWGQEYGQAFGNDAESARRFGRWIGARYGGHSHVCWIVSGEYDAINGFRLPITAAQRAVLVAMAEGLREGHGATQLMTIHPGAARTSATDFHAEAWLSFDMLQSGHHVDCEAYRMAENHTLIREALALAPPKPALDGEPIYEDTPDAIWVDHDVTRPRADGLAVRRKAYWSVFAGACGHTYGHNDVYGMNVPKEPGHVVPYPEGPGQRGHWRDALNAEGGSQMRHLRALVESRPFAERVAEPALTPNAPKQGLQHVAAVRASDGSYAMIYLPTAGSVRVALGVLRAERLRAWWFDPRTGEARPAGEFAAEGEQDFTPPADAGGPDWVLVLDDVSHGYGKPGEL